MRGLALLLGVVAVVCMVASACWASGSGGELRLQRTLWVLPPAVELELEGWLGGHRSLEIGLTPGLWGSSDGSEGLLEPRLGVFIYPEGECEGVAIYLGVRPSSTEIGLWYVYRSHGSDRSSGSERPMSFRIGIGAVRGTDPENGATGRPGFGAAIGFSF